MKQSFDLKMTPLASTFVVSHIESVLKIKKSPSFITKKSDDLLGSEDQVVLSPVIANDDNS